MLYYVKWPLIGRDGTAVSPAPHQAPQSAFAYADMVAEVLGAMQVEAPHKAVWVENNSGERVERPDHTTDS
jgi:hypothetical protein